jgi:hypothetical protein
MNINRNVSFGSGVGMPSGCEVESASLRAPIGEIETLSPPARPDLRGRLDDLKSKIHDVQRAVSNRTAVVKSSLDRSMSTAKSSVRDGVQGSVTKVQGSMRTSPMKWAGVAAGSGLALGLLGRILHARSARQHLGPQLVIIETSC